MRSRQASRARPVDRLCRPRIDRCAGAIFCEPPPSEECMRPFEGIKVVDATHLLAGPFASYQLALLGADVTKVEAPDEPDHTRTQGHEKDVRDAGMGSGFLTQSSNK